MPIMEAIPCSLEETTPLANEPSSAEATMACVYKEQWSVDIPPPAEAKTTPPPVQKNRSVDAVTLSVEKEQASGDEGTQSTEISSAESSSPIGGPSFFFHRRRNIVLLGRDINVPDIDGAALFAALVSLLYALLTPWLLWRVGVASQPTTLIWTNSLVSISYFLIGTTCLSETMGWSGAFLRLSGGALLAVAASHVIGPVTGAATASLVTFYGAGMLGYSIGEYLQRVGVVVERSADVVTGLPARDEEQEKRREEWIFFYCFQLGIISLFVVARMVWVLFVPESGTFENPVEEPLAVVQELSVETHLLAWIWMVVVAAPLLEQAAASRDSSNTLLGRGLACLFAPFAPCIVLLAAKCLAGSMLVMWAFAMASVGLFSYYHARYKHIRSRSQPVSAKSSLSQDGPNEVLDV